MNATEGTRAQSTVEHEIAKVIAGSLRLCGGSGRRLRGDHRGRRGDDGLWLRRGDDLGWGWDGDGEFGGGQRHRGLYGDGEVVGDGGRRFDLDFDWGVFLLGEDFSGLLFVLLDGRDDGGGSHVGVLWVVLCDAALESGAEGTVVGVVTRGVRCGGEGGTEGGSGHGHGAIGGGVEGGRGG